MKKLVISADDYAQHVAIDDGILSLIEMGRITAASCLVLSPRWTEAAGRITPDIRSKADIGLHLDFTQFPQYMRMPLPILIMRSLLRSLPRKVIRASIMTQLNYFEDAMGTPPDYIDGHQHVHQLPQIRDELVSILHQRYGTAAPWLRIARPPVAQGLKAAIIRLLGARSLGYLAKKNGLKHSQLLLGIYGFKGDTSNYREYMSDWLQIANKTGKSCVLMCHPGMENAPVLQDLGDPIYEARLIEHRIFSNDAFPALLSRHQIMLVRGRDLLTTGQ